MVGVLITQTEALQRKWPIWTQPQTKWSPSAGFGASSVWITRFKTFSSDLSLIVDAWFSFLPFCVLELPLLCDCEKKRRVTVRVHLSRLRRVVLLPLKAFPSVCLQEKTVTKAQTALGVMGKGFRYGLCSREISPQKRKKYYEWTMVVHPIKSSFFIFLILLVI